MVDFPGGPAADAVGAALRYRQEVGRALQVARTGAGISQSTLADRLGRSQTAVSYWEAGHRALTTDELHRVAEALGVEARDLLPPRRPADAVFEVTWSVQVGEGYRVFRRWVATAEAVPGPVLFVDRSGAVGVEVGGWVEVTGPPVGGPGD